jgi:hypothetical protein
MPQELLQAIRGKAAAAAAASGMDQLGMVKRTIVLDFLGLEIALPVRDMNEEINLRLACFFKAESVGRPSGLSPLFFEVGLLPSGLAKQTCRISPDVLKDYKTARLAAHDLIQKETVLTGEMLSQVLASREALYLQIDGTFAIELAIVKALAGAAGERRLHKAILHCFPSESKQCSLQQVSADLARLASSELHRIVTRSAQTSLEVVREMLQKMEMGHSPEDSAFQSGGFMEKVGKRMGFFIVFKVAGGGGKPSEELHGKDAYCKKFDIIAAKHSSGKKSAVTLADLEELVQFAFLATDGQKEILQKMVAAATKNEKKGEKGKNEGAKASSSCSAASASSLSAAQSKADKLKQAKADSEVKHVMSLFD